MMFRRSVCSRIHFPRSKLATVTAHKLGIRYFSSNVGSSGSGPAAADGGIRFSTLLSKHLGLSRRQSERMILTDRVTLFGKIINSPTFELSPSTDPNQDSSTAMKVDGKLVTGIDKTLKSLYNEQQQQQRLQQNNKEGDDDEDNLGTTTSKNRKGNNNSIIDNVSEYANTRVWLANKLKGELITEDDPVDRPSMIQRLSRGGVGKSYKKNEPHTHLKPVGRLDMMTEGLMIFTNDGKYSRELELPSNKLHRTYRVRVHGRLTPHKMRAMRKGVMVRMNDDNYHNHNNMKDRSSSGDVIQTGKMMKYGGMKVSIERKFSRNQSRSTNTWLQITCTEGKNRQLRRILGSLGLDITRLIRISYGDFNLNTIPAGRAIEVKYKDLKRMKKKGPLFVGGRSGSGGNSRNEKKKRDIDNDKDDDDTSSVQWVNYS